ncbi:unnamed protein product [Rodentolepis nana]|uniref:BAH domain-containing protein n=1 Tax=Rodentolepis nana TaxID=102285 RepID=A0A0R3TR04_RODNA|nr:unnamed protein product [Rodentolepis nana]
MARGKATRKAPLRSVKQKRKPPTKSRRKPVRKKHMTKKNVPQISYKDSHSIGRRKSTNVPTYSESGRLYYDLHVRYGPSVTFENKEEKPPKDANHCCGFESTISDSTTIACKESTGPSSSTKKVNVKWKKKRRLAQKRQSPVKSTAPLNSRREASLNAEAKVNMLFESVKESKNKRRSLPALPTTITKDGVSSESGVKLSPVKLSPSKRTTKARRTRVSEPPPLPVLSPPQKRLAGLNATAIISACIKSSESDNKKPRRGRPPKSSLKSLTPKFVDANSSANENVQTNPTKPSSPLPPFPVTTTIIASSTTQFQKPTPCSSNAITTLATVSADTKVVPASAVSTLERFQSQKVISYGSKCIGVENISRQIIHVPGQSPCVPCTSCSNPVSQQLQQQRIVPNSILPFSSSSQNHSMVMLPDSSSFCPHPPNLITSAADMQHHPCFTTNQFYLSPFSSTNGQHQQQQTFYMSIPSPAPQFQFFSAAPFAYVQPSAQNFMSNNSYMLPMSFSPQLYNGFPFGGGCFVPRPMFAAVPQPPHQLPSQLAPLPQTSLLTEVGSPPTVNQISQRIDRAVSPIKSSPSTSTPVKKPLSGKRNPAAVSMITTVPVVEKEKPSPCLWAWVGEPSEKRIFLKVSGTSILFSCCNLSCDLLYVLCFYHKGV